MGKKKERLVRLRGNLSMKKVTSFSTSWFVFFFFLIFFFASFLFCVAPLCYIIFLYPLLTLSSRVQRWFNQEGDLLCYYLSQRQLEVKGKKASKQKGRKKKVGA